MSYFLTFVELVMFRVTEKKKIYNLTTEGGTFCKTSPAAIYFSIYSSVIPEDAFPPGCFFDNDPYYWFLFSSCPPCPFQFSDRDFFCNFGVYAFFSTALLNAAHGSKILLRALLTQTSNLYFSNFPETVFPRLIKVVYIWDFLHFSDIALERGNFQKPNHSSSQYVFLVWHNVDIRL